MARGSAAQATDRGPRGNSELDGAHSAPSTLWCQEENTTRYCGKVAAVQNVIFVPRSSAGRRNVAPQSKCGRHQKSGGAFLPTRQWVVRLRCAFDGPQDEGKNTKSKIRTRWQGFAHDAEFQSSAIRKTGCSWCTSRQQAEQVLPETASCPVIQRPQPLGVAEVRSFSLTLRNPS